VLLPIDATASFEFLLTAAWDEDVSTFFNEELRPDAVPDSD